MQYVQQRNRAVTLSLVDFQIFFFDFYVHTNMNIILSIFLSRKHDILWRIIFINNKLISSPPAPKADFVFHKPFDFY